MQKAFQPQTSLQVIYFIYVYRLNFLKRIIRQKNPEQLLNYSGQY